MLLFAFSGAEWTYGQRVTYSFAPDGTDVGGVPNSLDSAMAARGITSQQWKDAFRRAAATWQATAAINLVEVPDDGSPISAPGNQQGDPRFGDIRIVGTPLNSGQVGLAFLGPPINGGTLAGDIVLNTSTPWNVNANTDVLTVAMHEMGHSLGLGHSAVFTAQMYPYYTGVRQALDADDAAGMQALYGARPVDAFDSPGSNNNSYSKATSLNGMLDAARVARVPNLDITTPTDNDWFVVTAPAGSSTTLQVSMQSSGLSSLMPRFFVFDASLRGLGAAAVNTYGGTATLSISGVTAGRTYYVRAMAGTGFGNTGTYGLTVNFGTTTPAPFDPPNTMVAEQPSQGGGSMNQIDAEHVSRVAIGSLSGFVDEHDDQPGEIKAPGGRRWMEKLLRTWAERHDNAEVPIAAHVDNLDNDGGPIDLPRIRARAIRDSLGSLWDDALARWWEA